MSIAHHAEDAVKAREGLGSMIRRVKIRNYKSIKNCDVELGPFTILVGRNGSGKSNFLDAIRFVAEGVRGDWISSFRSLSPWAGVAGLADLPREAEIELELQLSAGVHATYSLRYDCLEDEVREERLTIKGGRESRVSHYHCLEGRIVDSSEGFMPIVEINHPYLIRAASIPEFRPAYDALTSCSFHDLDPAAMRGSSRPTDGTLLNRLGSNLARAFNRLESSSADAKNRVISQLRAVVPEVEKVFHERFLDGTSVLEMSYAGNPPKRFFAEAASSGTLRVLGILVAINQLARDGRPIRLVGIEEPETALHPAAAGALMDAFRDAATHTQVLVTTHGADLLDRFDPEEDHILAVEMRDGRTEIGPVNPASRDVIREHLFSAGELLRMDQLHPDRQDVARQAAVGSPGPNGRS